MAEGRIYNTGEKRHMKSDRLYTWADVQNEIYTAINEENCPDGFIQARVFWDGFHITVRDGKEKEIEAWLEDIFEIRFRKQGEDIQIILDSLRKKERYLEVYIDAEEEEDTEEAEEISYFRPMITKPTLIRPQYFNNKPRDISHLYPPIFAFHSFKGGVGRTIHAIALGLLATSKDYKVLLVDGDLEAPGITWMLGNTKRRLDISFADMLALVHGDPTEDAEESLELIADRIKNIYIEKMFILPAFRSSDHFASLSVKPEHLIQYSDDPYVLTHMLGRLGKLLEVDAVIVDLRAGLSEISAGLLLDPRIHRIFVTTLSDQSLTGTHNELEYIGKIAKASEKYMPMPNIIISMIPELYRSDRRKMSEYREPLHDKLLGSPDIYETPFDQELLVLPKHWESVTSLIRNSKIIDELHPLLEKLRAKKDDSVSIADMPENLKNAIEYINSVLTAEDAIGKDFFYVSDAMKRLTSDFSNKAPIATIEGSRKSGKTTFFNYIIQSESWESVVEEFVGASFKYDALIAPIFIPSGNARPIKLIEERRKETAGILGFGNLPSWNSIWEKFVETDGLSEKEWRKRWLDYFAWSLGFHVGEKEAGNTLLAELGSKEKDIFFVLDLPNERYLDEKFDTKTFDNAKIGLLQALPDWLDKYSRRLGMVLFASPASLEYDEHHLWGGSPVPTSILTDYDLEMSDADALRFSFFLLAKLGFSQTEISEIYKLQTNELMDKIELKLKKEDFVLTGYQLKSLFGTHKNDNNDITPYIILNFFKKLFEISLAQENVTIHIAANEAMSYCGTMDF